MFFLQAISLVLVTPGAADSLNAGAARRWPAGGFVDSDTVKRDFDSRVFHLT
jgi:cytochrome c-type biogenesis protein CcmE